MHSKRHSIITIVMSAILMLTVVSCGKKDEGKLVYHHFEEIGSEGWDPADVISFEPWPADSATAKEHSYRVELMLRSSARQDIQEIPLAVVTEDESGIISKDTFLLTPYGTARFEVKNQESFGIREQSVILKNEFTLTDGYAVNISPLADQRSTEGLLNVGIRLYQLPVETKEK